MWTSVVCPEKFENIVITNTANVSVCTRVWLTALAKLSLINFAPNFTTRSMWRQSECECCCRHSVVSYFGESWLLSLMKNLQLKPYEAVNSSNRESDKPIQCLQHDKNFAVEFNHLTVAQTSSSSCWLREVVCYDELFAVDEWIVNLWCDEG